MQVQWLDYVFKVYNLNTGWNDLAGVYIFAGQEQNLRGEVFWKPLYVGETGSFRNRLVASHEKWHPALRIGFSHIHAVVEQDVVRRSDLETRLIQTYEPELNRHHA